MSDITQQNMRLTYENVHIRLVLYSRPLQMTTGSDVQHETIPALE